MTALREHLAVLRSSMQRTERWDTLGERIRPPVNKDAIDRADAGFWFAAIVLVACISALLIVHFVRS